MPQNFSLVDLHVLSHMKLSFTLLGDSRKVSVVCFNFSIAYVKQPSISEVVSVPPLTRMFRL